jgi:uncharacterized membrane protein
MVDPSSRVARLALGAAGTATAMESRLKLHGQPVHPMLVLFPLGLFAIAVIFDFADLVGGPGLLGVAAYWNVVAGLIGGLPVAVAGLVDLLTMRRRTRSRRFAAAHTLITVGVLAAFAASWWLRMPSTDRAANGGLFAIEVLAVLACGFGAWLRSEPQGRFGAWADRKVRLPAQSPDAITQPVRTAPRPRPVTILSSSTTARTVRFTAGMMAAARRPAAR